MAIKFNEKLDHCYQEVINHEGQMISPYTDLYYIFSRNLIDAGIIDMPSQP